MQASLTLLLQEGADLMALKNWPGTDDIGSTEIYAHVDMSDFRKGGGRTPPGVENTA